jgi:hypothetical protein
MQLIQSTNLWLELARQEVQPAQRLADGVVGRIHFAAQACEEDVQG